MNTDILSTLVNDRVAQLRRSARPRRRRFGPEARLHPAGRRIALAPPWAPPVPSAPTPVPERRAG